VGPVVSRIQFDRVEDFIAKGIAEGAKVVIGGEGRPEGLSKGYYVRPTIFSNVNKNMLIAREEIFGPVLAILPYQTEEEAIRIANDTPYGLQAYVWSNDLARANRVGRRIRAGRASTARGRSLILLCSLSPGEIMTVNIHLTGVDYSILLIYFLFVLGIGFAIISYQWFLDHFAVYHIKATWVVYLVTFITLDFAGYVVHLIDHKINFFWNSHIIHHSSEELDWVVAFRIHPVDQILTKGLSLVPVVALGFSEWAIGIYALLYQWQSVLIHANVRIGFGPLRRLFASPEFHHWHHSNDREARDRNFAGQLSFLDALFGTLHMPRGRMPTSYGLDQPMPQRYAFQLLYPFVGDSPHRSVAAPEAEPPTLERASAVRLPRV